MSRSTHALAALAVLLSIGLLRTVQAGGPESVNSVDLCWVAVMWILVPATVNAPMAAIALFAPDVFAVGVTMTALAVGCAIARTYVAIDSCTEPAGRASSV